MKIQLSDLWRWRGTIDRGAYAMLGVGLALVKYEIDRLIVFALTNRPLLPWEYWKPGAVFGSLTDDPRGFRRALAILALALPFLWAGIVLTLRRLRSAGLPQVLVLLFFIPIVNVIFFLVLCTLPARLEGPELRTGEWRPTFLERLIPESQVGSAAMSYLLVLPFTTGLVFLSAAKLGEYGWGLFVGLPFFLGLASTLIYGYHEVRSLRSCFAVAGFAILLLAAILIGLALEGAVCIVMAAPIAFGIAMFGAFIGYLIQSRPGRASGSSPSMLSISIAMPLLIMAEHFHPAEPPLYEVTTAIDVDAPPNVVWKHVVAFSELDPPTELVFKSGIAYPLRAEIHGHGVGAVRHCVFSTGPFVEPIEVWDEPHRLEFSVSAQPRAMNELMPWPGKEPPHVSDYLVSRRGRFELEARPDGRTHLVGTTWYTHKIRPAAYWRIYSDWLLHKIHQRVLAHIQTRSEAEVCARR